MEEDRDLDRVLAKVQKEKLITESRPLKSVAREKWGTHDALRAQ